MRVFQNTAYPFVSWRRKAYVFSAVLILLSLVSLVTRGVATGIDFQGGTEFVIETGEALLEHRGYVIPEDVQAVLPSVVSHRLRASEDPAGHGGGGLAQWLLNGVPAV